MESFDQLTTILNNNQSDEFHLLIALIRGNEQKVNEICRVSTINWDRFRDIVEHHRLFVDIYPLIKDHAHFPDSIKDELQTEVQNIQKRGLQYMQEILNIDLLARGKSLKCLFYKGPLLSFELRSDVALRSSKDIDILIDRKDIFRMDEILSISGYKRLFNPALLKRKYYTNLFKDVSYVNQVSGVLIELHWQPLGIDKFYPYSFEELYQNKRKIEIGEHAIYTLSQNNLIHYLFVHGTMHKWFRLFWLKDIVEFYDLNSEIFEQSFSEIKSAGNSRSFNTALGLINLFFNRNIQINVQEKQDMRILKKCINEILNPSESISRNIFSRINRFFFFTKISPELGIKDLFKYICLSFVHFMNSAFVSNQE